MTCATELAGTPAQVVDRIGELAAIGASRVYLQTLDLTHLELVAVETWTGRPRTDPLSGRGEPAKVAALHARRVSRRYAHAAKPMQATDQAAMTSHAWACQGLVAPSPIWPACTSQ